MSKSILLVEDNPDDEALTLRALDRHRVANTVRVARDGPEALATLAALPADELPQLVLLDLKIPKLDGLEVLRQIRQAPRTRLLPVVILTSSSEEEDVLKSYDLGANAYVRKPVDFDQFLHAVERLGLFWLVVNQPAPCRGAGR